MAICGISQPVYLPWVGYFNLIARSDKFVFLDDVQFSKNSFGNRNKIPTPQGPIWLTIPILKGELEKTFNQCFFDETQSWRRKHLKTLKLLYGKSYFFTEVYSRIESALLDEKLNTLSSLSIALTKSLSEYLGLKKNFFRASELSIAGHRSERILAICRHLQCSEYLSAQGAKGYIAEDNVLPESELKIIFQNVASNPYNQITSAEFQSHMSIVDVLFNMSRDQALSYILKADEV